MLTLPRMSRMAVYAIACIMAGAGSLASAATLFDEVHTVATASQAVPVEETFTISTTGSYQITLTDLGAQLQSTPSAALTAVDLAITDSSGVPVSLVAVSGSTISGGNQLKSAGSATFSATAGTYIVHVLGTPATSSGTVVPGSGTIGLQVVNTADSSQVAAFSDTLAVPASVSGTVNSLGVLDDTFTVTTAGDYQVTLTDLQLPQAMATSASTTGQLTMVITVQGGSVVTNSILSTAAGTPAVSGTVTLAAGTYRIFAAGQADSSVKAGLYSVILNPVSSATSTPFYSKSVPVGEVSAVATPTLTAGTYALALSDLGFPNALTKLGAAVTVNGQSVAQLAAAGSQSFTAIASAYEVFAFGTAGSSGMGSYALTLTPSGGSATVNLARAVTSSGYYAYSFDTTLIGGEVYSLTVADFALPAKLASIEAAVVQNGAVLGSPLTAVGTLSNIVPASGTASVLVFAQPTGTSGSGLFGVNLIAGGAGTATLATTQGVGSGQLFSTSKVTISTGGTYQVTVSDVGFPSSFASLAVVVTQGATTLASIYNAGTFTFQAAAAGDYYLSFVATPQSSAAAGTYAITLGPQPPAPTVTLQATATSVVSGNTVTLQWSTTNATACTASGGWTGTQSTSGQATTAALTADTTFTLTCTGNNQSAAQSVTVTVTGATASSSHGGGGAIGTDLILVLCGLLILRVITKGSARPKAAASVRLTNVARVAALAGILLLEGCGGAASRLESHLQRGRDYLDKGDYTHASIEFRNAMQIAPNDLGARLLAATATEKLGRYREAAGLYQSVIDVTTDTRNDKIDARAAQQNLEARAALARLFVFSGAPERALELVAPSLAKHPDDVPSLLVRATAKMRTKDEAGALEDADHVLKLAPNSEDAIALRAGMYRRAGDLPKAIELVSDGIKRLPQSVPLHQVLAELFLTAKDNDKAEGELRALIKLKPQEMVYRKELAAYYAHEQKLDDAQRVLEDAVKTLLQDPEAKLTLVRFLVSQRTRQQGEDVLRGFIAKEPKNYELRFGLADLLQRAGATPEAVKAYEEIIAQDGTGPKGLIARDRVAAIDLANGQDDAARQLVEQVLQKDPRDSDALLVRGELELKHKDATAAISDLRAVLRDQPTSVPVQRLIARAYVASGDPALAEQALRAAMDVAPGDASLRVELAQLLSGTGRTDQAVTLLEETVRKSPTDVPAREALVRAYIAKSDLADARKAADDLKALRPDGASGYYLAGLVAQAQNRPDDAENEYQHALSLQPKAFDALLALARLKVARGHVDQAVALAKAETTRDPDNALAMNLLGELYFEQKNTALSLDTLAKAVSLAPTWWSAYRDLAMVKLAANDPNGAIATYEAAIKVAPGEPRLVTELAQVYEKQARVDDAIAAYETWNKHNPNVRAVANNLAMMLVTYKNDRASLDLARQLTTGFETTSDGMLLDTNGWVHFKRAEYADALPVLERAAQRAPDSKEIRYHLGMAELHAGKSDRARSDLEMAVSGTTQTQWSQDARSVLAGLRTNAG